VRNAPFPHDLLHAPYQSVRNPGETIFMVSVQELVRGMAQGTYRWLPAAVTVTGVPHEMEACRLTLKGSHNSAQGALTT